MSIHMSMHMSIHLSIHMSIHIYTHGSVGLVSQYHLELLAILGDNNNLCVYRHACRRVCRHACRRVCPHVRTRPDKATMIACAHSQERSHDHMSDSCTSASAVMERTNLYA